MQRETSASRASQNQKECPTILLRDLPAEEDQLALHGQMGPHERVARSIAELVAEKEAEGGISIALAGGWGSGKTTVVNLIRNLVKPVPGITLISFDAWAHEGDPLRRTFLETLIRHFQRLKWVTVEEWDKELDVLAKRRRISSTRTVPKTTRLGKIFTIAAFLIPIGSAILTAALSATSDSPAFVGTIAAFVVGIILVLAPFFVLLGNWIRIWHTRRKKKPSNQAPAVKDGDKVALEWAFLVGEAITEERQECTETPDPTSIEFEDCFRRLMDEALDPETGRKALIVLDNLDRVPSEDALAVWATLQTFLQNRHAQADSWFKRLWILVPFDPAGIGRLWAARAETRESPSTDPQNQHVNPSVADSFIDKSFQVRYEVPQLVLSNWRGYLLELLEEALPAHGDDERRRICQIYSTVRPSPSSEPTPRELKLYVNLVGTIHRQWQHRFPIPDSAYYAALQRAGNDVKLGLLNGSLPHTVLLHLLSKQVKPNLAGLAFNIDSETGYQILLTPAIHDALARADGARLAELEGLHPHGFWTILEAYIQGDFREGDAREVAQGVRAVAESGVLNRAQQEQGRYLMMHLRQAIREVESWGIIESPPMAGMIASLGLASEEGCTRAVLQSVRNELAGVERDSELVWGGVVDNLVSLIKAVKQLEHGGALAEPLALPISPPDWYDLAPNLEAIATDISEHIAPRLGWASLSKDLCLRIKQGVEIPSDLPAVLRTTRVSVEVDTLEVIASEVVSRLRSIAAVQVDEAENLIRTLFFITVNEPESTKELVEDLASEGFALHYLSLCAGREDKLAAAFCVFLHLQGMGGQLNSSSSPGQSAQGGRLLEIMISNEDPEMVSALSQVCRDTGEMDWIALTYENLEFEGPLLLSVARNLGGYLEEGAKLETEAIARRWRFWKEAYTDSDVGESPWYDFLTYLLQRGLLNQICSKGRFTPEDSQLYLDILHCNGGRDFEVWCGDGLRKLTAGQWGEFFTSGDVILDLVVRLEAEGHPLELETRFVEALVSLAEDVVAKGKSPGKRFIENVEELCSATRQGSDRKYLRRRLIQVAVSQPSAPPELFFKLFGSPLSDIEELSRGQSIVTKLFVAVVRDRVLAGIEWLCKLAEAPEFSLQAFDDTVGVEVLGEHIRDAMQYNGPGHERLQPLVRTLADLLGVDLALPSFEEGDEEGEQEESSGSEKD